MAWYDDIGTGITKAAGSTADWFTDKNDTWTDNQGMSGMFFGGLDSKTPGSTNTLGGTGSSLGSFGDWAGSKSGSNLLGLGLTAGTSLYGMEVQKDLANEAMDYQKSRDAIFDASNTAALAKTEAQEGAFADSVASSKQRAKEKQLAGTSTDWYGDGIGLR